MTSLTLAFNLAKLVNEEVTEFAGHTIVSGDLSLERLEERLRKVIINYLADKENIYAVHRS